jgi:predicted metal-dependent HD superfamily phosphohydrolase
VKDLSELSLSHPLPPELEGELRRAYSTPPRAYHHFGHVLEVLAHFTRVPRWDERDAAALAILFHDAIYEPGRGDNEARSAELADACLRSTPFAPFLPRVRHLILLTAKHGQHDRSALDRDAAQFLDCDMAILGAASDDYDAYARAIAEEYAHVPRFLYRSGRARFLRKLLASPRIYLSEFFHAEREASARRNVEGELAALDGS